MHDLHGGVGRVHALAAGAAGATDFDAEILRLEFEIDFFGFRQHGDGGGGGVNAALRFGRRHALHAMHAALVTQLSENRFAGDLEDHFLQAAELGRAGFEVLDFQSGGFRVAVIHPVKISREDRRFAPAGAGADFHDGVAVFVFVRRQERELHVALQIGDAFLERRDFFLRHLREVVVVGSGEFAIVRELAAGPFSSSSHFASKSLIEECSRMVSLARFRLSKRCGSAISRSSSAKRSRLRCD